MAIGLLSFLVYYFHDGEMRETYIVDCIISRENNRGAFF
jgi:hypothetical protein